MRIRGIKVLVLALCLTLGLSVTGCGNEVSDTRNAIRDKVNRISEVLEGKSVEVQKKLTGDNTLEVDSISQDKYAYQQLDDTTKKVYDEVVYAVMNRMEDVQVATKEVSVLEDAIEAMRSDYAGFFWLGKFSFVTYTRGEEITAIEITPEYTMTAEEQQNIQTQIDAEVDRILSGISKEAGDYEKALYVFETLAETVEYDTEAEDNQTIISAFVNHATVCQGYAYATQYLLDRLEIPCATVTGTAKGVSHAWNLVKLDGSYYYMDTTWGNPQFVSEDEESYEDTGYIDYSYFCVNTETLFRTHTPDGKLPLPECTELTDNYFYHEGLYIDYWDSDSIGALFGNGYKNGQKTVQVQFANGELREQFLAYFIDDAHIWDYCSGAGNITYLEDEDSLVFVMFFDSK